MRRIVVDTNYLERPELESYLKKSSKNRVVLAAIEMYKCEDVHALRKRISIIRHYEPQIDVMKSTYHVCAIRGRKAGLQKRLIDDFQTSIFPRFIKSLDSAVAGDARSLSVFSEHAEAAKNHMHTMLHASEIVIKGMVEMYGSFSQSDLLTIRSGRETDLALTAQATKAILAMTYSFFQSHPNVRVIPNAAELPYTYLFRVAVSVYFYTLDRAKNGIALNLSPKKVRNDMIDIYTLAYGTLFNGLFSGDDRANRVFKLVREYLEIQEMA
jgi:hypothetical protein